ncbi:Uncharacterized protein HZ326_31135 [Fusarium oxysporum f. sp. albedinis]|nr:Uncharacterized protein HZ326_31135 [Fusarium oxysporum f. sp. albedinis]
MQLFPDAVKIMPTLRRFDQSSSIRVISLEHNRGLHRATQTSYQIIQRPASKYVNMARKVPGHDHTGKAAHRLTESRRVYNASRNENDDPPACLRIGSPAGKNRPSPRLGICPVTSPVQVSLLPNVSAPGKEQCKQHDLSDAGSRSSAVQTIRNPPIPGDLAPSADALFARVNSFAKNPWLRCYQGSWYDSTWTAKPICPPMRSVRGSAAGKGCWPSETKVSKVGENLGGYSSTAALIKLFDDKEIPYFAEWAKDSDRNGLVWSGMGGQTKPYQMLT